MDAAPAARVAVTSPSSRTLSKSDFALARSCEAKLFFRENHYADTRAFDSYLQLLADGGYMVEALACASRPDAILLDGWDAAANALLTREYLARDEVTLFQATLMSGRRFARVDILEKRGNVIRLLDVKAKSFDGAAHAANLLAGGRGEFRARRSPFSLLTKWESKFEDLTYQTLLLERLLPGMTVLPFLVLVDKSKRSSLDNVPSFFELVRHERADGTARLHTVRFSGSRDALDKLDLLTEVDASIEVAELREMIDAEASRFEKLLDASFDPALARRGAKCGECEFRIDGPPGVSGFARCWGDMAAVTPHALELFSIGTVKDAEGMPLMESLARDGKASLFDIPEARLVKKDGSIGVQAERQLRQIRYTRAGGNWTSPLLASKLAALSYPLHFIDFEATRLALPYHAGMRPYGQVAFQWSCHTVDSPGAAPRHAEWLNDKPEWPNISFVRTLRDVIGGTDTVLTWSPFEGSQLKEIGREHATFVACDPALTAWVDGLVNGRIFDLHKCAMNDFYHPGMRGETSIKVVLDALWKSDATMRSQFTAWTGLEASASEDPYRALSALEIGGVRQDVREGTGAIRAYEAMMYGVEKNDDAAKSKWRQLLRQYCKLDTLSMVLIFEYWRRATGLVVPLLAVPLVKRGNVRDAQLSLGML